MTQNQAIPVDFFNIDLKKLQGVPDLGLLLQLLAAANDVNSIAYLAKLVADDGKIREEELGERTLQKYKESLQWGLFKLRVTACAEALYSVVTKVRRAEKCGGRELWDLIKANPRIEEYYRVLVDYLPADDDTNPKIAAGKYNKELSNNLFIRNKLTSHHDSANLLSALDAVIKKCEVSGKSAEGWIQDGHHGQFTRFLFIDNLEMVSWYMQNDVALSFAGYDNDPRVIELITHLKESMMPAFVNFASELLIAYINKYRIANAGKVPEWLK